MSPRPTTTSPPAVPVADAAPAAARAAADPAPVADPRPGRPEGMRRGRGFGRPGGWQQGDLPSADDAQKWFAGRLPDGWFDDADSPSTARRSPSSATLTAVDAGTDAAEAEGRISRFRAETREQRIAIAQEARGALPAHSLVGRARRRHHRPVHPPRRAGHDPAAPARAAVLDTLVDAGVARSAATRSPGRFGSSASTPTPGSPTCARRCPRSTSCAPRAPSSEPSGSRTDAVCTRPRRTHVERPVASPEATGRSSLPE